MDYRKYYVSVTGYKLPKGFVVHHIDFDRNNNNILNLVALPRELHGKYHAIISNYIDDRFKLNIKLTGSFDGSNNYYLYCLDKFITIENLCAKYIDYRNYLLGKIPDIHNIGENYGNI